jgi:hypothetical protein
MERQTIAGSLGPGLKKLIWLGAAAAWIAFGLYVYKFAFATGQWFVLSNDRQDWGTFGDFFGGILNPFFSYLAFLGVLFTVILQARQLDEMRNQAGHDEMQRVQSSIAERIDGMLSARFVPIREIPGESLLPAATIFDVIAALGTFATHPRPSEDERAKAAATLAVSRLDELSLQTFALRLQLESLSWMLIRYRKSGGNATVMEYYAYRYAAVLHWLDALKLLEKYPAIHEFFKPRDVGAAPMAKNAVAHV